MIGSKKIFANLWGLIIILSSTIVALFVPLRLSIEHALSYEAELLIKISGLIFLFDLLLNCYYYLSKGSKKNVFGENHNFAWYAKNWLPYDIIPIIPFIFPFDFPYYELLHLAKLVKVVFYMRIIENRIMPYNLFLSFMFGLYWVVHAVHWISCIWLKIYHHYVHEDVVSEYIHSLYWCITTLSTVGYGDIVPTTNVQMIFTSFIQVLGISFFGLMIGKFVSMFSKRNPSKVQYQENLDSLISLNHYRKLDSNLQRRVRDYFLYVWKTKQGYNESEFLNQLPESLKTDVAINLKINAIESIPLFKHAGEDFKREICVELDSAIYTPGDYVFNAGDIGMDMYFVVKGQLEVLSPENGKILNIMTDGDFFGEIALLKLQERTTSVRAVEFCDLYVLSKKTFSKVIKNHPDIATILQRESISRGKA